MQFSNWSQINAMMFLFVFGVFVIMLPFVLMSLISANRHRVRKKAFETKYGMLTEEVKRKDILQLMYYPIFLFQRVYIVGVIVFGYQYPIAQVLLVMLSNAMMCYYLITVKPYKQENQQATAVVDELVCSTILCFFIVFLFKDMSLDERSTLGMIVIAMIVLSILKNLTIVVYYAYKGITKKLSNMFGGDEREIDSQHTDDTLDKFSSLSSLSDEALQDELDRIQEKENKKMEARDT